MHLKDASLKRRRYATILTFLTVPLSGFMTDVYLPSFPAMAENLQVSEQRIQLTLTAFFLSYGIVQLFVGGILDSTGRHRPVLGSLVVLFLSSLAVSLTRDIWIICLLRVIQGVATSFIVVAKRAYFVDLYNEKERKNYLGYFTIVWSCGPIIAPFLGGYLESFFSWEANFYFLALYAAILLLGEIFISGETIRNVKKFNLKKTSIAYRVMLRNKGFLFGILILGISYSVVMVFNIAGPFVVEEHFNYTPVVIGYCTLILGISWMVGGIVSKWLIGRSFNRKILFFAGFQLILVLILIGLSSHYDNIFLLISFAFVIHVCSGFLFTNYFTNNMLFFPSNAGISGGLMGGLLYIITSISSYIIAASGTIETTWDMGWRYLLIVLPLGATIYVAAFYRSKRLNKKFLSA